MEKAQDWHFYKDVHNLWWPWLQQIIKKHETEKSRYFSLLVAILFQFDYLKD